MNPIPFTHCLKFYDTHLKKLGKKKVGKYILPKQGLFLGSEAGLKRSCAFVLSMSCVWLTVNTTFKNIFVFVFVFAFESAKSVHLKKMQKIVVAMGKPNRGYSGSGWHTSPPIYLREYWEHSQDFWDEFSTTLERNFFCVRNFCRPPETPLWGQRGVP